MLYFDLGTFPFKSQGADLLLIQNRYTYMFAQSQEPYASSVGPGGLQSALAFVWAGQALVCIFLGAFFWRRPSKFSFFFSTGPFPTLNKAGPVGAMKTLWAEYPAQVGE